MSENVLFDRSYTRIFGEGVGLTEAATPFFEAFYGHFLEHPEIARAFRTTDMSRQVSMLRKSFFHLAAFYVSHEPPAELTRLADLHQRLGIDDSFYDLWLDALVSTVYSLDPECDLATELAWRWAMTPGLTYMRMAGRLQEERR
ncbi:MAG: globin [Pseudomonadales bacterium]|jgi:truncated hemoglobin YjbI